MLLTQCRYFRGMDFVPVFKKLVFRDVGTTNIKGQYEDRHGKGSNQ